MAEDEIAGEHLDELGEAAWVTVVISELFLFSFWCLILNLNNVFSGISEKGFAIYSQEPKILSREEAADCLTCVGPSFKLVNNEMCYTYPTYAYIVMEATNRLYDFEQSAHFTQVLIIVIFFLEILQI